MHVFLFNSLVCMIRGDGVWIWCMALVHGVWCMSMVYDLLFMNVCTVSEWSNVFIYVCVHLSIIYARDCGVQHG